MRSRMIPAMLAAAGALILGGSMASGQDAKPAAPAAAPAQGGAKAEADRVSYSLGYDMGAEMLKGLKADGVEVSPDLVAKGVADALRGQATMLSADEVDAVLVALHKEVATKRVRARMASDPVFKAFAENNAKKSAEFHANFAKKESVVTLPSGCQYLALRKGDGAIAKGRDTVTLTFRAVLISGQEFARGDEQTVKVATLNEGARELVGLMREGDKWQVAIPASRAFGEAGREPDVGPNESIIADVELVKVQ